MKIEKSMLGLAGEYAVASELCKRNIYAQLTLGNQKRTDLLIFQDNKLLKIEVKCKQIKDWPNCKGIADESSFLVFVDFQNKKLDERPDFYILNVHDWSEYVKNRERKYLDKHPGRHTKIENNVLHLLDEVNKHGKHYQGTGVLLSEISNYKERWDKITDFLK